MNSYDTIMIYLEYLPFKKENKKSNDCYQNKSCYNASHNRARGWRLGKCIYQNNLHFEILNFNSIYSGLIFIVLDELFVYFQTLDRLLGRKYVDNRFQFVILMY